MIKQKQIPVYDEADAPLGVPAVLTGHKTADQLFYERRNLPELAYVVVDGAEPGERIGIIKRGERGYHLTDYDRANAAESLVREVVDRLNARMGVTPGQREAMHIGSVCGWDVPGADATRYDEHGNLIRKAAP